MSDVVKRRELELPGDEHLRYGRHPRSSEPAVPAGTALLVQPEPTLLAGMAPFETAGNHHPRRDGRLEGHIWVCIAFGNLDQVEVEDVPVTDALDSGQGSRLFRSSLASPRPRKRTIDVLGWKSSERRRPWLNQRSTTV
jgi:hypothetical protein